MFYKPNLTKKGYKRRKGTEMSVPSGLNFFIKDEPKLQHIAFRMSRAFPSVVDSRLRVPVNVTATHHQKKGDWCFPCRVPLSHTSPKTTPIDDKPGNCYIRNPKDNCCDGKKCRYRCNSVLEITDYCQRGLFGSQRFANYGFLMFVMRVANDYTSSKDVYKEIVTKNMTTKVIPLLYLYGYIDGNENYIALPVCIENDLDTLKRELIYLISAICQETYLSGNKKYNGEVFDAQRKVLNNPGSPVWKRTQRMFCQLLVHLRSVRDFLTADHVDLLEKAEHSWTSIMGSPADWIASNQSS